MSTYNLPAPPSLKTTIIQLNKDLDQDNGNFEILTNEYKGKSSSVNQSPCLSPVLNVQQQKKKRRRSNSNVNDEELAKRKFETKQLHSIIEKRRRIKINREFEALKYLIPACRLSKPENKSSANNNSKIDGMYKLTILKSSVEYILYLHHLIQKQLDVIKSFDSSFNFDLNFSKFPLDVNEYRNIDKDFSFVKLVEDVNKEFEIYDDEYEGGNNFEKYDDDNDNGNNGSSGTSGSSKRNSHSGSSYQGDGNDNENYDENNEDDDSFQLPSPLITPDMPPNRLKYNTQFQLPDPALTLPRKKLFKSIPKSLIINEEVSPMTKPQNSTFTLPTIKDEESDASKALLSLRKSSIDSLLN